MELSIKFHHLGVNLKSKNDVPPIQNKSGCGQISYSGKNAKIVLDWLYKNSDEKMRLTRKFELYKTYF